MQEEGMALLKHYREYSFMGLWEVIKNAFTIRKVLRDCKQAIHESKPEVMVLVDFPGFNLRMAEFAKKQGIQTCYYISPKIWAWKKGRIKKIRKVVDKMLVILPFEVDFYTELNFEVDYVGNPLMDAVRKHDLNEIEIDGLAIAVLPGSRHQEVAAAVPVVAEMARMKPNYHFWVAGVDNLNRSLYAPLEKIENVEVIFDRTYDLLKSANASVVTSGTATLEACLLSSPQVVVYKTSWLTFQIGKRLVNIDFISLVNLIAGREVVKELIQHDFNAKAILEELDPILNDPNHCGRMMADYQEIKEKIGFEPASKRAAETMTRWLGIQA